jgi:hypothetical protein
MVRVGRRSMAAAGFILLACLVFAALSATPAISAVSKSKDGFSPQESNERVLVEEGAEAFAAPVARFLEEAIGIIESAHGRPFKRPFRVYVCASQKSLNEFLGLPPRAPIRGAVRLGEVFLAPSAFQWLGKDLHRESLLHELSHLHLRQQLGFVAHRGRVPSWFHEGLANLVSGAGGEGVSREEAVEAILVGSTLRPDSSGNLWSRKRVEDSGLGGPMFHMQSKMFLGFIRDRDPDAFRSFLLRLQEEKQFAGPFRERMGMGVGEMWAEFSASLEPR